MNINQGNIPVDVIDYYNEHDFNKLSDNLNTIDKRIELEKWLLRSFSAGQALPDLAWHSQVISLICTKIRGDSTASSEEKEREDTYLATLVSRAEFSAPQRSTAKSLDQLFSHTIQPDNKTLDIAQIHANIQDARLPSTCQALLKIMQYYPDFNFRSVFRQAIQDRNISMLKTLSQQMPAEFKAAVKSVILSNNLDSIQLIAQNTPAIFNEVLEEKAAGQGKAPENMLSKAIKNKNIEMVRFILETFSDEDLKIALKTKDKEGRTPLSLAYEIGSHGDILSILLPIFQKQPALFFSYESYSDESPISYIIKTSNQTELEAFFSAAPEEFRKLLLLKDAEGNTPVSLAIKFKNLEAVRFMAEKAPQAFEAAMVIKDKHHNNPLYWEIRRSHSEVMTLLAEKAPNALRIALLDKDQFGNTFFSRLVGLRALSSIYLIAEKAPEVFESVLRAEAFQAASQAKESNYTSLANAMHKAPISQQLIDRLFSQALIHDRSSTIEFLRDTALSFALTTQDGEKETLLSRAIKNKDENVVDFILKEASKADLKKALTIKDKDGRTPLSLIYGNRTYQNLFLPLLRKRTTLLFNRENYSDESLVSCAVKSGNVASLELLATKAPADFKKLLLLKDAEGNTPVALAIKFKDWEAVRWMVNKAPEEFQAALLVKDKYGKPPLNWAVLKGELDTVGLIAKLAPKAFEAAMLAKDEGRISPLLQAVGNKDLKMIQLLAENSLAAFKEALFTKEIVLKKGGVEMPPFYLAVIQSDLAVIELLLKIAPDEFKAALIRQDNEGRVPLHIAAVSDADPAVIELLIKISPASTETVSHIGETPFSLLKRKRPQEYDKTKRVFKEHMTAEAKEIDKLYRRIVSLSHAWDIGGASNIKSAAKTVTIEREGHSQPEWYHLMQKDFTRFKEHYPNQLSQEQQTVFERLFELGTNVNKLSVKDRLDAIKAGKPVVVETGSVDHAVTLLIWNDQLIICNRGARARKGRQDSYRIEAYHFDPLKMNEAILKRMENIKLGSLDDYEKFFVSDSSTFQQELGLFKNRLDRQMEASAMLLPEQEVGNCSFVSPSTAIYAALLIGNIRGVSPDGHLIRTGAEEGTDLSKVIEKTYKTYWTWLYHLKISFLEQSMASAKTFKIFTPDYPLIMNAFFKAYTLTLEDYDKQRLQRLKASIQS